MYNILITGASGVLAKKLINKFIDNPFNVISSSRNIDNLAKINDVKYITNNELISTDILKNIDIIINCAFPRRQEPQILVDVIQFYNSLIMKAVEMGVKGIVNISSQSVYDSYREIAISELAPINPSDNYGLVKYAQELIGLATVNNTNTKLTNIRLASLIGAEYEERVINKIINNARSSHKISINNDKNVFGYLDVDDAVDGIFAFVKNTNSEDWSKVYNLGAPLEEQKDFEFIAKCINKLFLKQSVEIELSITNAPKADKLCYLDSRKFYKIANWKPNTTLKESIEKIFNKGIQ